MWQWFCVIFFSIGFYEPHSGRQSARSGAYFRSNYKRLSWKEPHVTVRVHTCRQIGQRTPFSAHLHLPSFFSLREEAEEKILKTAKQGGSGTLAAWEEELNDVSLRE